MILLEHLPFEMDAGIAVRARIGLIVLATDHTIEHEWRQIFHQVDGVALYHSRIPNEDVISPESFACHGSTDYRECPVIDAGYANGCRRLRLYFGEHGHRRGRCFQEYPCSATTF